MDHRDPGLVALGRLIRQFREANDMIQKKVSHLSGYAESTLSSVETGQEWPSRALVEAVETVLKTKGALVTYYDMVRWQEHPVACFERLVRAERRASEIYEWIVTAVPGLVQTPDYARALLAAGRPGLGAEAIEALVTARVERQAILDGETPPTLSLFIDEAALRRPIGGREVHRAQLDRLIEMSGHPCVTVQAVPLLTGAHAGLTSSFLLLGFPEARSVAYSEDPASGFLHERPDLVKAVTRALDELRTHALPTPESLGLIKTIREEP